MAERRRPATASEAEVATFKRELAQLLVEAAERRAKLSGVEAGKRKGAAA